MISIKTVLFLLVVFTVAVPASGAEDIMPMVPGPYAVLGHEQASSRNGAGLDIGPLIGRQPKDEPVQAARPQLHKNVIRLTLPAGQSAAALNEELAPFVYEKSPAAPIVAEAVVPAGIPGLMTPESLASLPSRDFRKDLTDLVSFDGQPVSSAFSDFESAAYTMPISIPTYVAPAPEEFVPEPPPVASLSLPRPTEVVVPPPIAESMPPLPYLDPLSQPHTAAQPLNIENYSSKTEALVRIPSNAARIPVRPPTESNGGSTLRPPLAADPIAATTAPAQPATQAVGSEVPMLSGPLLSIRSPDDAPARARKSFIDQPEVISGVPALAPTQFRGKAKTAEVATETVKADADREEAGGFAPLRTLRNLIWSREN